MIINFFLICSRFETDQKTVEFIFVAGAEAIEGAVIVPVSSAVKYYSHFL